MQKEQIVGIAVRLFAVFLAIYVLRYSSGVISYIAKSTDYVIGLPFLAVIVLFPLLAALLLWLFPLSVASRLIPDIKAKEPPKALSGSEAELIAFSVLGLWVLASAVPDVFNWVTFVYLMKSSGAGRAELSPDNIGNIVATVIELVIGFWLLFGSRGVIVVVKRMRHAGS